MSVSEKILAALQQRIDSGETYYSIGKATGVNQQIIARFHRRERKQIRSETIDRLCEYLGLDLAPTAGHQPPSSAAALVPLAEGSKKAKRIRATSGGSAAGEVTAGRLGETTKAKAGQSAETGRDEKRARRKRAKKKP